MSRQTYSPEFKQQVLQEVQDTHNATIVARHHQVSPSMVRRWTREARQSAGESQGVPSLVQENTQLKRLVIERDLQIVVLQDAQRSPYPAVPIMPGAIDSHDHEKRPP